MNATQRKAIENEIAVVEDDLARARMQKQADPNWKSGNGETINQLIAQYRNRLQSLKEGLPGA